MTMQVLNRVLGGLAGAAAVAFMIVNTSAQAQQVQQGADGCFYTTFANQFIPPGQPGYLQQYRLGCTVRNAAGQPFYHDEIDQTWTDLTTGFVYQVAADGRQYLRTTTGWVEVRVGAAQEQSTANSQPTTQQTLGQQPASEFAWKQFRDAQDGYTRSVLNFIRTCSGEKDYLGCVEKDRRTNGYDCYSGRDISTKLLPAQGGRSDI